MKYLRRKSDKANPYTKAMGLILIGTVAIGYLLNVKDHTTIHKNDIVFAGVIIAGGILLLWPDLIRFLANKSPFGRKDRDA